jgi:hypothetical protein
LQRKCACGGIPGPTGECEECRKKRLQRQIRSPKSEVGSHSAVPPIVHEVLRTQGQPLDVETRAFMESRFGYDFRKVRIHADARAAESARAVNALAYTVGRDVVFGAGQYAPTGEQGRTLLAHELTHVLQQGTDAEAARVTVSKAESPAEAEACKVGKLVARGKRIGAVGQTPEPGVIARAAQSATVPNQRPQPLQFDILAADMSVKDDLARAAAIAIGTDIRVTSLDDMISKLEARAGSNTGACVQRISIWNHAKPGLQFVAGAKPVCVRDPDAPATKDCSAGYRLMRLLPRSGFDLEWLLSAGNQAALSRLRGVFCCDAAMDWLGCSTAGVEASGGLRTTAEQGESGRPGAEARWAAKRFGDYGYRYQSIQDALAHEASMSGAVFGLQTVQAWADGTCATITASNDFTFFDPAQPRQLHHVGYGGRQVIKPPTGPGHCTCDPATGRVQGAWNIAEEKAAIKAQEQAQLGGNYLWHVHLRLFHKLKGYSNRGQYQAQLEQTLQSLIEDVAPTLSIPSELPRSAVQPWFGFPTGKAWRARVQPHLVLCFPSNCWRWIQVSPTAIETTPEFTKLVLEHEFLHAADIWQAAQLYRRFHGDPPTGAGDRCVPIAREEDVSRWTDPWGRYVNDFWDSLPDPSVSRRHVEITSAAVASVFSSFTAAEKALWFQGILQELPPDLPATETFSAEKIIEQLFRDPNPNPQLVALREEMAWRLNKTTEQYLYRDATHKNIGRARSILNHFLPAWKSYRSQRENFLKYLQYERVP